jgi:hypothetical protein
MRVGEASRVYVAKCGAASRARHCKPILSTPCFTLPSKLRTPSRIPSVCNPLDSPLPLYTPVPAGPPTLKLTPPRLTFNAGAFDADSGGGS